MSGFRGTITCFILFLFLGFASFVVSVPHVRRDHVRRDHVVSVNPYTFNNGTVTPSGPFPAHLLADAPTTDTSVLIYQDVHTCGASTFEDRGSEASPLASDCLKIAENIADGGTWTINSNGDQRQLVEYQTCAFGVESVLPRGRAHFLVGNRDIIDAIKGSVARFERTNGRVGSRGLMNCQYNLYPDDSTQVMWGLYGN